MKKLALILLMFATPAFAESWFLKNEGNGEIVITSDVCKADGGKWSSLKHAYAWTDKLYQEGCWLMIDGNIQIIWVNPDNSRTRRVYRTENFMKKENY